MTTLLEFPQALRKARTRKGLSQALLVKLINERFAEEKVSLSVQTIKDLEVGRTTAPRETTLIKIAAILPVLSRFIPK